MLVQDIMTREPVCCVPQTDVNTLARLMCQNECGSIPIVKDQTSRILVGIVTSQDIICRVLAKGEDPQEQTAQDCLSALLVTVTPEDSVEDCCQAMEHSRVRRMPVVDASGACCGIVSLDEIAFWAPNHVTAALLRAVMHLPRSASLPVVTR